MVRVNPNYEELELTDELLEVYILTILSCGNPGEEIRL